MCGTAPAPDGTPCRTTASMAGAVGGVWLTAPSGVIGRNTMCDLSTSGRQFCSIFAQFLLDFSDSLFPHQRMAVMRDGLVVLAAKGEVIDTSATHPIHSTMVEARFIGAEVGDNPDSEPLPLSALPTPLLQPRCSLAPCPAQCCSAPASDATA